MDDIEAILKCLLDNLEEGIHIVDSESRTIFYNKAMGRMEGLKPDEVIGRKVIELIKGLDENNSTLMNAIKTKKTYTDIIQNYSSHYGKEVTTINTTVPILLDNKVVAALEVAKDMTQLKELNDRLYKLQSLGENNKGYYAFEDIVTVNEGMKREIEKAKRASLSNSSVLIYGETGCGKEIFAQAIHYCGLRRDKVFLPINCAAIPSALLEGLLFGTVKGSFTGAENKKGLFEEADKGTVLLDEVNSMEPVLQSKLLRVLQEGYIRPVGGSRDIEIDIRIIATLNEEPDKLIREGKLRKDFFYRLGVVKITIPPLRERREDIPVLIKFFMEQLNRQYGKNIQGVEPEVLKELTEYHWPGNVRELKNMLESAVTMSENQSCLTRENFEGKRLEPEYSQNPQLNYFLKSDLSLEAYLEKLEKEMIIDTLSRNNNNISRSAEVLKISRQLLQYKLKKYKLP